MASMAIIFVRTSDEIAAALKEQAYKERTSVNAVVNFAINSYPTPLL